MSVRIAVSKPKKANCITPNNVAALRNMILRGETRAVLLVGPWAFKFSRNEYGARCNRHEAGLFRRCRSKPHREAMLCPVLWCSRSGNSRLHGGQRHRLLKSSLMDCGSISERVMSGIISGLMMMNVRLNGSGPIGEC